MTRPQHGPDSETTTGHDPRAPHDRDETPQAPAENAQHDDNRETIRQAHDDVESGIEDTERIGTPNNVPSSDRRHE